MKKREEKEKGKKLRHMEIGNGGGEEGEERVCVLHVVNHGCCLMDGSRF